MTDHAAARYRQMCWANVSPAGRGLIAMPAMKLARREKSATNSLLESWILHPQPGASSGGVPPCDRDAANCIIAVQQSSPSNNHRRPTIIAVQQSSPSNNHPSNNHPSNNHPSNNHPSNNHPSGDPTPSDQDLSVTERLEQTAEVVGIPLIDHIVVGVDKAISIQEWLSGNQ